jgi:hypothetical protein
MQVSAGNVQTHSLVLMWGPRRRLWSGVAASNPQTPPMPCARSGLPWFKMAPAFTTSGVDSAVTIGRDWREYVIYFRATATDPAAQLNFYFGDQPANTWLDAVVLQGTAR